MILAISLFFLTSCVSTGLQLPDWSLFGGKASSAPTTTIPTALDNSTCPPVANMPDLNRMVEFEGQKWVSEITLPGAPRQCQLVGNMLRVTINLNAIGRLGPEGQKQAKVQANYTYPYLIAVIDKAGNIASKDVFALNAVYQKAQADGQYRPFHDNITQSIPAPNGVVPVGTHIQIGFQLSPAELAYNRQNPPTQQ